MTDVSLAELLASVEPLAHGTDDGSFRVRSIPGYACHYVGRNNMGQASLLLGSGPGSFHAPVRLAMLEARFGNRHHIHTVDGGERQELLSVITCISHDAQAQAYFLHVCETILRIVGPNPALQDIVQVYQRLIELFRHLSRPAFRSLNGLLGELCLIAASRDVRATVAAWRSTDIDRFDFSTGNVRLDVKASGERLRVHHLSAEQCQPPAGTVGLLASLFIEGSGGGQSLRELVAAIEAALAGNDDLILKVQETIAETLGESLPTAMGARFDDHLARASLRFYDLAAVPAVRDGVPAEVSQVHFRSDLSRTEPLSESDVLAMSETAFQFMPG
ncbi:PD-(D/E)XK motif protein [Mesorhizobium sp. KR1-2]|uniref:PD-(D/E)XK motif protein n=1 Tax=Mesorhizobium sp. KR1-2 TaxID=3156609 RepID=UPI0032B54376